jgi:hypothetical protein
MATRTNTRTRVSGKKRAKTPVSKGVRSKEASLKVAYEVEVNKTEVQTLAVVEGNRGKLKDDKDYNTNNEDDSTELDHAEKENRCESHFEVNESNKETKEIVVGCKCKTMEGQSNSSRTTTKEHCKYTGYKLFSGRRSASVCQAGSVEEGQVHHL